MKSKRNTLIKKLNNKKSNEETKIQAIFSLMNIGDDKSLLAISKILEEDECPIVRHEAAFALGETSNSDIALGALKKSCLKDNSYIVIHEALLAIGTIANKDGINFIQKFIQHENDIVRRTAKIALQRLNYEDGQKPYNGIKEFNHLN